MSPLNTRKLSFLKGLNPLIESFNSNVLIADTYNTNTRHNTTTSTNFTDNRLIYEQSKTVLITFDGQTLSLSISIFSVMFSLSVHPYIARVTQCHACFRFGHVQSACKSRPRCIRCRSLAHPKD